MREYRWRWIGAVGLLMIIILARLYLQSGLAVKGDATSVRQGADRPSRSAVEVSRDTKAPFGGIPDVPGAQAKPTAYSGANSVEVRFYGCVVDQFGVGVPNVLVTYQRSQDLAARGLSSEPRFETHSDRSGRFALHNITVDALTIEAEVPEGYRSTEHTSQIITFTPPTKEMEEKFGSSLLPAYQPDPDNPIRFVVRKIISDPLVHWKGKFQLSKDGKPTFLSLIEGSMSGAPQDLHSLSVALLTNETSTRPSQYGPIYDWRLEISAHHGGLVENYDPRVYDAPTAGYVAKVVDGLPASTPDAQWHSFHIRNYFVRFSDATFARVHVDIRSKSPASVSVECFYNPSGGVHTEWDPKQEIKLAR